MSREEEVIVKQCYHSCPFFGGHPEMECCHPYWEDKGPYDNMIIRHDNSIGRVPDKCPLRLEEITTIRTVKLDKNQKQNKPFEKNIKVYSHYASEDEIKEFTEKFKDTFTK